MDDLAARGVESKLFEAENVDFRGVGDPGYTLVVDLIYLSYGHSHLLVVYIAGSL